MHTVQYVYITVAQRPADNFYNNGTFLPMYDYQLTLQHLTKWHWITGNYWWGKFGNSGHWWKMSHQFVCKKIPASSPSKRPLRSSGPVCKNLRKNLWKSILCKLGPFHSSLQPTCLHMLASAFSTLYGTQFAVKQEQHCWQTSSKIAKPQ